MLAERRSTPVTIVELFVIALRTFLSESPERLRCRFEFTFFTNVTIAPAVRRGEGGGVGHLREYAS
jgi:hypothetical protein